MIEPPPPSQQVPLTVLARRIGVSLNSLHRWRTDPVCPLPCWPMGGSWRSSEEVVRQWQIRRLEIRTGAAQAEPNPVPSPSPTRRQREIEAAGQRVAELLKPRKQGARS